MELPPTVEVKTKRVFLRNNDSGECGFYCGELSMLDATITSIGHFVKCDLQEIENGGSDDILYSLYIEEMTDAEVEALPDM